MKKLIAIVLCIALALAFTGCGKKTETLKVGASVTPHAQILAVAKDVLAEQGIELEIVEFSDYVIPNTSLESGDLDANYFQHFPYLENFDAENGTDLTVGMIPEGEWKGGGDTSLQGIFFNPNIPTEECFISPKRGEAEGIVYASKPLSYQGQLIENFSVRFEKGKAVEVKAEKGEELLKTMIAMDDGASYLGECALVPQHSPIAESGILFYNTLFDENAACHLALGMGFADTIKDFQNKTLDECRALGINDSMIHEDFMIGCDSMNIDGICEDGKVVPIFRSGNWAF